MNELNRVKINKMNKSRVETLKYIQNYRALHRFGPSVRTIRGHFKLKSTSPVTTRLRTLEKLKYIERTPGIAHAIWVTIAGRKFVKDFENEVERAASDARTEWKKASLHIYE